MKHSRSSKVSPSRLHRFASSLFTAAAAAVMASPSLQAADGGDAGAPREAELLVYQMTEVTNVLTYTQLQFQNQSRLRESTRLRSFLIVDLEREKFRIIIYRAENVGGQIVRTYEAPNIDYDFAELFQTGGRPNFLTFSLYGTGNAGSNCSHEVVAMGGFNDSTTVETISGRIRPETLLDHSVSPPIEYRAEAPALMRGKGVREWHNDVIFGEARGYESSQITVRLKKGLTARGLSTLIDTSLKSLQTFVIDDFLTPRGFVENNG